MTVRPELRPAALLVLLICSLAADGQSAQGPAEPETPKYSRKGADTCLNCHDDATALAIFAGRHGVPSDSRTPFGHGQLQCEACHGPGGLHTARVRRGEERPPMIRFGSHAPTPVRTQNAMCAECHAADLGFGWHGSAHDDNAVACADCHSAHAATDPVLATATQAEVCFACHTLQRAASLKPFGHPLHEGKMDCGACHDPHGSTAHMQLARQTVNQTCYECHADKRGPFLWEHAPVAEDCTICHAPHGSTQPAMLVRRGPLLCQSCHAAQGHPSLAQTPAGLAGGSPSKYLLGENCLNCHSAVHGSNHPSGSRLMR
jgi:DmsE family decaheme c-type cytochrome